MPDIKPILITAIATLVPTLISGWLSAVVTNRLNAERSNREKFWELRRAAYGSILTELAAVEAILATADEYMAEDEYRYFDGTVAGTHNELIAAHMKVVRRTYTDNYLICSDEFIALFEGFLLELEGSDPNDGPSESHERFCLAVRAARPKLLQQGRREMPVPRSLWHSVRRLWD
jgi:hypothetical protein